MMADELLSFIGAVHREGFSLIRNNCIHKSLVEEMGGEADLIYCLAIVPIKKFYNFPIAIPHVYTLIEGRKVDVALDPQSEEVYCKNDELKLVLPVNISKVRRIICREASN
jgi:hypothetical protein